MSKRVASTANAVSLFPFLAVLICAMGALILLLLVTTRRIRQEQAEQAASVSVPAEPAAIEPTLPNPAPPTENDPPVPRSEYLDAPLSPLFALDPAPALPDPNDAWRARLKALSSEHTALAAAVVDQERTVARVQTAITAESSSLDELRQRAAMLTKDAAELDRLLMHMRQDEVDTDDRAAFLKRKIDETREQLAHADSQYSIMPFDGRLGTTRRPIIIECTEDGITFVSEGVSLRAADLNGFTPRYNPILYAARGLSSYWARKDRLDGAGAKGESYVLIVVRPKGTVAYYVTRKLLGPKFDNFGYELVREDQEFVWPASDPAATRLCREIVDRMMAERDALYASMPESSNIQVREFSDETGAFRLDEIDRIRNPASSVTINGMKIQRTPLPAANPGALGARSGPHSLPGHASGRSQGEPAMPGRFVVPEAESLARIEQGESEDGFGQTDSAGQYPFRTENGEHPLSSSSREPMESPHPSPAPLTPFADYLRKSRGQASEPGDEAGEKSQFPNQARSAEVFGKNAGPPLANASPDAPAMLDLDPVTQRDIPRGATTANPQWGIRRPGGLIGFEREVLVRVTSTQVTVADETAFSLHPGMTPDELRNLFAAHLNNQVKSWGEPPRSFYWLPTVSFMV
ncbi:MAG: hypothetical protein KF861_19460, partial [Planctomycetaceae bacterium]|nr:hypothetical protein [Planctomycetaceae bacterium]